jgi:hypothetical protein
VEPEEAELVPERAAAEAVQGAVVEAAVVEEPEEAAERAAVVEEPELAAAAEVEPALVQLQDPVLARVRQLRSARAPMHRLALAQALPLVWVRREAPEWAPVPVRLRAPDQAGRSGTEPATGPETEPETKVLGLKTEPALERQRSARKKNKGPRCTARAFLPSVSSDRLCRYRAPSIRIRMATVSQPHP